MTQKPGEPDAEHDFSEEELAFFGRLRRLAEHETEGLTPREAHRLFLGIASELIDAAADLATHHRPGVRVVELSLLATRTAQLAHDYQETAR